MGTISSAWRTLTDAQRLGWKTLGENMTRTDSLGQTYTLTGQQAFASVNRNLLTYGAVMATTAPAFTPPVSITSATVTATSV
jgi:hypothetical protein